MEVAGRLAMGPTQPHTQWVPGALPSGVKQTEWSYTSAPRCVFMAWCLIHNRDNLPNLGG